MAAWGGTSWADAGNTDGKDEFEDDPSVLPERHVSRPDADGIKTITEYYVNEDKKKVKVVRKAQITSVKTKVHKDVLKRRQLPKFGDCAGKPRGPEKNITYVLAEDVVLDLSLNKKEEEEEKDTLLAKLSEENKSSVVICRHCGETGHWTLKCPKRNEALPPSMMGDPMAAPMAAGGAGGAPGKYVPPSRRAGAKPGGFQEDDTPTLRVTNLPEDITEDDLRELFRAFGHTSRIYLAKDRNTGQSRGFAFVSYQTRDDGQRAIDKLHGHGYANLILHVEWAKPREEK